MTTDSIPSEAAARTIASYQHWFGIATFLRCPHQPDLKDTDIGLIGVPYSGGNAIERMQYLGPRAVRNRSASYGRSHRKFRINPFELARVRDLGDVAFPRGLNPDLSAEDSQAFFAKVFKAGIIPVSVGGDRSITWPILRARKAHFSEPVGIIHFDSHTDAGPESLGTRNNAAGFCIGAEDGVIDPRRTVQVGIRGPMGDLTMDDWAQENFAAVITTDSFVEQGVASVLETVRKVVGDGPTYLSFDLDVIDPGDAPGVADPEINGIRIREIMELLDGFRGLNLVGADVVCFCPPLDNPSQITAMTSSLLLLQFVTLIADRHFQKS
jgi:guanidinopropionase